MCSTNITHLPIEKNSPIHNLHLNIIFAINCDILNQNHAYQYQKADDMAAVLPFWNLYVWPVNLRVYPPKKLDLRVARKQVNPRPPLYLVTDGVVL